MYRSDRDRVLNGALVHYRDFLRRRGFTVSIEASSHLRGYITEERMSNKIMKALRVREKTSEDLIQAISEIATLSSEIASLEGRREVTKSDVEKAIKEKICKVWPLCK